MPSHCVGDGGYVPCMPTMGSDPAIVFYLVSFQLLCLHLYLYGSKKTLKTSKISVGPTLPLMVKVLASCQRQMLAFPTDCLNFSTANSQKKQKHSTWCQETTLTFWSSDGFLVGLLFQCLCAVAWQAFFHHTCYFIEICWAVWSVLLHSCMAGGRSRLLSITANTQSNAIVYTEARL